MLHLDYNWDLNPNGIILDAELDINKLGWKAGDLFQIVNVNDLVMLRKLHPVEQIAKGHKVNFGDNDDECN